MKDDAACARDVLKYALRARAHVEGLTYANFIDDAKSQDAAFRCLEIMGEATKRISADYRAAHPEIPWSRMAGFRDVLAHGYDGLDYELCWKIIMENVPAVAQLEAIIPPEKA